MRTQIRLTSYNYNNVFTANVVGTPLVSFDALSGKDSYKNINKLIS